MSAPLMVFDGDVSKMVISLSRVTEIDKNSKLIRKGHHLASMEVVPSSQIRFDLPPIRRLINETHGIFLHLQARARAVHPGLLGAEELVSFSLNYRSTLRALCLSLQERNCSESLHLLDIYRGGELVWSLVEMLFIRPQNNSVISDLIDWARLNFTLADERASEIVYEAQLGNRPEVHPQFWNTVYNFVLLGRCSDGGKLLRTHSLSSDRKFELMDELLRKIPLHSLGLDNDEGEFHDWQMETKSRLDGGCFDGCHELQTIAKILIGDESTWSDLVGDVVDNWYEAVVGLALYQQPDLRIVNLTAIAIKTLHKLPPLSSTSSSLCSLDLVLMSVFELDIPEALRQLSICSSDWWLVAHLADLMAKTGYDHSADFDLAPHLLMEFGASLMLHHSLWTIGVDYTTINDDHSHLAAYLERISLDDEKKAMKVLSICEKYNLCNVASSVVKQMTTRNMKKGAINAAVGWCIQSKDPALISFVVEKALLDYGRAGLFDSLQLLNQFEREALISPALVFLQRYHEFHSALKHDDSDRAGSILVDLLVSRAAPRRFWPVLFRDAFLLLDKPGEQLAIGKKSTYELFGLLAMVTTEIELLGSAQFVDRTEEAEFEKQLAGLRLALFRNLGMTIVSS